MTRQLRAGLTLLALAATALAPASAQDTVPVAATPGTDNSQDAGFLEVLPPDAQADVAKARSILQIDGALTNTRRYDKYFSVISRLYQQIPNRPVSVCFFGISTTVRRRIADAARGWEFPNSSLRFNFGTAFELRTCAPGIPSDVRVGSNGRGTWSLIGREADVSRPSNKPSMNLDSSIDWGTLPTDKFRRIVQHEFGHAIGLYHEHQNPKGNCINELKWDTIKAEYGDLPEDYLRKNFIANISPVADPLASAFDDKSIMLYFLPAGLLQGGEQSICYHRENMTISPEDQAMIEKRFTSDASKSMKQRLVDYTALTKAINDPAIPDAARADLRMAVGALYPFKDAQQKEAWLAPARSIMAQR